MERLIEKWQDKICEVVIGVKRPIKIGGETGIYFIDGEDKCPNPTVVAMEVWDMEPDTWPEALRSNYGKVLNDPGEWAKICVDKF